MRHSSYLLKSILFIPLCISAVMGCGPSYYWTKPSASQQDFDADITECRVQAARDVPVDRKRVQTSSGYQLSEMTNCYKLGSGVIQCTSSGGGYIPPSGYSYDTNRNLREDAIDACLYRKGWTVMQAESQTTSHTKYDIQSDEIPLLTHQQSRISVGSAVVITMEPLGLYKDPSRESERLQRLYKRDTLLVEEVTNTWLKVRTTDGKRGWIMRNLVTTIQ